MGQAGKIHTSGYMDSILLVISILNLI